MGGSNENNNSGSGNVNETFNRLHSDYDKKQRSKLRVESEQNEKFREEYPFQPTRIAKGKDKKMVGKRESS
jgi:hypothetical protein